MLIAIDCGKYATKGVMRNKDKEIVTSYMRTKYEEETTEAIALETKGDVIEWGGKRYIIGEHALKEDYDISKARLPHKLTTYVTIAKFLEGASNRDVQLVMGCPFYTYIDTEAREDYAKFMLGKNNGGISFKLNGKPVEFKITEIKIFPESVGYPHQYPVENFKKIVAVIDIGGLNVNGALYKKLRPLPETIFTLNEGGNILCSNIKREVSKKLGIMCKDYDIENIMDGTYTEDKKKQDILDKIIRKEITEHIDKIISEAKRAGWDTKERKINFTGGTSKQFASYIEKALPNAIISENAIYDNVIGFYEMGERYYEKKKK